MKKRCFLEFILGTFWPMFAVFLVRAKSENTLIYGGFVPLAWKKYFLQHAENRVNTTRAEHMNNTNAHTAIPNLWHRRSATFAGQQGSGPYTHCAKRWTASRRRSAPSKLREEIKGYFSAAMVTAMEAMEEQASKAAPAPATPAGGAKQ